MRRIFLTALLLFLAPLVFAQETEPVNIEEPEVFVWATLDDYRPLMMVDDQGNLEGFHNELMVRILNELRVEYEIVIDAWPNIYAGLLEGTIHMFPSTTRIPSRDGIFYWPEETSLSGWATVFTAADRTESISTLFDLNGKTIGYVSQDANGIAFRELIAQTQLDVTIVEYETFEPLVTDISEGVIDGGAAFAFFVLGQPDTLVGTGIIFNATQIYATGTLAAPEWARDIVDDISDRLIELRSDPESYYYELQEKHFIARRVESEVIPDWLIYLFAAVVLAGLFAWFLVQVLTRKIRTANNKLATFNKDLEVKVAEKTVELEKANKQLVQSEKMSTLGEAVSGVAHEINTPLGVAYTALTLLSSKLAKVQTRYRDEGGLSDQDLEKHFSETTEAFVLVETNLSRANDLMRSFQRVTTDQTSDVKRRVSIPGYFYEVWNSVKPKYNHLKKDIAFEVKLMQCNVDNCDKIGDPDCKIPKPCVGTMTTWAGKFAQILTSSFDNSFSHGFENRDKGRIRLTVVWYPVTSTFHMIYEDDGVGIPEDHLEKVMEPFYTTKVQDHTGLGLPVIYKTLEAWDLVNFEISNRKEGGYQMRFSIHLEDDQIPQFKEID